MKRKRRGIEKINFVKALAQISSAIAYHPERRLERKKIENGWKQERRQLVHVKSRLSLASSSWDCLLAWLRAQTESRV